MDSPATESTQAPQSTEKDRLASLLKTQYGDGFKYEPPEPEPAEQSDEVKPGEVERHVQETTDHAKHEASPVEEAPAEPEGQPADDFETVDVEGTEYRVPKELKDHLLRDKDYRHKTMELAEVRKSVDAERQYVAQARNAAQHLAPLLSQLGIVSSQLQQIDATNWGELQATDPIQYSNLQHARRNLVDQGNALHNQLGQASQAIEQAESAALAAEAQRNEPIVRKTIKDWGPQKQKELSEGAISTYGFTQGELSRVVDARHVQVLNDALAYRKLMANQPKAITAVRQAPPVSRQSNARAAEAPNVELKKAESRFAKTGEQEDLYRVLRLRSKP